MDSVEKEQLINRICSGCVDLDGFLFQYPSPKKRYIADLIYNKALTSNFSGEDALSLLRIQGKWNDLLQKELSTDIPKILEDLKLQLFQSYKANKSYIPTIKDKIEKVKERLFFIISLKRLYDEYTDEWQAERARLLFLLEKCVKPKCYPENLIKTYYENQISDDKIRLIARSNEWATKWTAFKNGVKIFSKNSTPEQESLIKWTSLYESILEQQEAPDDEVIEDDDALDGWMIWRKRERNKAKGLDELENRIKDKGANEVFIPVNPHKPVFEVTEKYREESRKVALLNSPEAERIKRDRLQQVMEKGSVKEFEVIDGKLHANFKEDQLKLMIARNNAAISARKGK